jgi:hypothetical protein
MARNNKHKIVNNSNKFYKYLRDRRNNIPVIRHYPTQKLRHPTVAQRASIPSSPHLWRYGDRYYNLANIYYGDPRLWWVIAWYNGKPTEADVNFGDVLYIPTSAENALRLFGY